MSRTTSKGSTSIFTNIKRPLKQGQHATRLVRSLGEDETYIVLLCEKVERINELLDADYNWNPTKMEFSFQTVWFPFLRFVTKQENTAHLSQYRMLLDRIFNHNTFFWANGITAASQFSLLVPWTVECALVVAKIIKSMLRYIMDSAADTRLGELMSTMQKFLMNSSNSQFPIPIQEASSNSKKNLTLPELVPRQKQRIIKRDPNQALLPGNLSGTPRHDNDSEDFHSILITPTGKELLCEKEPYLPADGEQIDHVDTPIDAYLETQFRLLREDTIRSFRESIQFYLTGPYATLQPDQTNTRVHNATYHFNMHNFRNLEFMRVLVAQNGLVFEFQFDQPPGALIGKKNIFWKSGKGSKMLQKHNLVCILAYFGPTNTRKLFLGTVSDTNTQKNEENRCTVQLAIENQENVIEDLLSAKFSSDKESLLLEVSGHFFSSPCTILKALQCHTASTIPMAELLRITNAANPEQIQPPFYLRNVRLNFCDIMKEEGSLHLQLQETFEQTEALLIRHQNKMILDPSQLKAFLVGIYRPLALIQGPPGTGKSFVGAKLVQFLTRNTATHGQKCPILCVCYTNHALDQFLTDLMDSGFSDRDIIRIGGRSQEDRLEPCNLFNRASITSNKHERYLYAMAKKKVEEACREFENLTNSFNNRVVTMEQVADYIEYHHELEYSCFLFPFLVATTYNDVEYNMKEIFKIWLEKKEKKYFPQPSPLADEAQQWLRTIPWTLSKKQRAQQYEEWTEATRNEAGGIEELLMQADACKILQEELNQQRSISKLTALREAKIVGVTTSGCGNYRDLLQRLAPSVVICEEAGEVIESHIISALSPSTEHLIMIGDHQQLRPKLNEHFLTREANRGFSLDISLFERLVESQKNDPEPMLATLSTQRRMKPCISSLIRNTLYPDLKDYSSVKEYPTIAGMKESLWFFDHDYQEDSAQQQGSHKNTKEAEYAIQLARYFLRQGYTKKGDITILTPYVGQLLTIRASMARQNMTVDLSDRDLEEIERTGEDIPESKRKPRTASSMSQCVRISTVDNFQGEEATIIILSLVRCNPQGIIGFLKTPNRVNVMLSRARHGMFILGSSKTIEKRNAESMLGQVVTMLRDQCKVERYIPLVCQLHKIVNHVSDLEQLKLYCRDGGCLELCDARLPCGHQCRRKCHTDDPNHKLSKCVETCTRVMDCDHPCEQSCSAKCICKLQVNILLDCGHSKKLPCCQSNSLITCKVGVTIKNPKCGHSKKILCHKLQKGKIEIAPCLKRCQTNNGCGHQCENECGKCPHNKRDGEAVIVACSAPSKHRMMCGHDCTGLCGHSQAECPPCLKKCNTSCAHSSCKLNCKDSCPLCAERCSWKCFCNNEGIVLYCQELCGVPCTRLPCNKRCAKNMKCGHRCTSICGERCPKPDHACPICVKSNFKDRTICALDLDLSVGNKDWSPDVDPIIMLHCGHVVTVDTLDGVMMMSSLYNMNQKTGEWESLKEWDQEFISSCKPECPYCSASIRGIFRYGRALNLFAVVQIKKKYITQVATTCTSWRKDIELATNPESWESNLVSMKEEFEVLVQKDPMKSVWEKKKTQNRADSNELNQFVQPFVMMLESLTFAYTLIGNIKLSFERREKHLDEGLVLAIKLCTVSKKDNLTKSYTGGINFLLMLISLSSQEQLKAIESALTDLDDHKVNTFMKKQISIEDKKMVFKAMQRDVGSGIGSFGGHWFHCPNGHLYTIGECGGAVEESICPECGDRIGGRDHVRRKGNEVAAEFLKDVGAEDLIS